jgi:hypothetical protein
VISVSENKTGTRLGIPLYIIYPDPESRQAMWMPSAPIRSGFFHFHAALGSRKKKKNYIATLKWG